MVIRMIPRRATAEIVLELIFLIFKGQVRWTASRSETCIHCRVLYSVHSSARILVTIALNDLMAQDNDGHYISADEFSIQFCDKCTLRKEQYFIRCARPLI